MLCFVSVLCVSFEFVDHGGGRGNTAQALDRWWHPVAFSVAPDVLHRAQVMRPASLSWKCRRFRCRPQLVLTTWFRVFPTRQPDTLARHGRRVGDIM